MADFLFLMHDDYVAEGEVWQPYLDGLAAAGVLRGGSEIGSGVCVRRAGMVPKLTGHLVGYVKIVARDLAHAEELVSGNPVYEAGGTVEIRELPRS